MFEDENKVDNIDSEKTVDIKEEKPSPKEVSLGKRIALFFVGCLGIQAIGIIVSLIVALVKGSEWAQSGEGTGIINFLCYGLLFITLISILGAEIVRVLPSFKNWKNYVIGIGFGILLIIVPIGYSYIINLFRETGTSGNEEGLRSFITIYPVTSLIILGVIGPICEELTYRVGLFSSLKKWKWLAYVGSAIIFALVHFSFSATGEEMITELLNLPVYIFSGVMFALAYDKFGLACSLTAHMTNNLFSVGMVILASILE